MVILARLSLRLTLKLRIGLSAMRHLTMMWIDGVSCSTLIRLRCDAVACYLGLLRLRNSSYAYSPISRAAMHILKVIQAGSASVALILVLPLSAIVINVSSPAFADHFPYWRCGLGCDPAVDPGSPPGLGSAAGEF